MSAVDSENMLSLSEPTSTIFSSSTVHPSTGSRRMRSNHIGSWVKFWMWTSKKIFSRSVAESNAEGDLGACTLVLTESGLVT